jgi:sarcosine oxidase subunit gamma
MPETLSRQGPLDGFATPAVAIGILPPRVRFSLRGRPASLDALGVTFGVALPRLACSSSEAGERAALWLGPDEWLLLAPEGEASAIEAGFAGLPENVPHSLVDIGHRQLALEISGPKAARVLHNGCPLDLDLEAFPVGMCTRTVLGKAEIVLWRRAEARFHVEIWRSFAPYARLFLAEAAREFTF